MNALQFLAGSALQREVAAGALSDAAKQDLAKLMQLVDVAGKWIDCEADAYQMTHAYKVAAGLWKE